MSLPQKILVIHFEGAPVFFAYDDAGAQEFLADVLEDGADSYEVWAVFNDTAEAEMVTFLFAIAWSERFEFGSGDDWTEILRPFPDFVRAHAGDELLKRYRAAQSQLESDAFERANVRSL